MYELIKITDKCFYIESPAKIGLIKTSENEACLIDSGNDKDAAKKVLKILNEMNLKLTAIYNTHSNADHIGGNKYLQTKTGCNIYSPTIENAFTLYPQLEPAFLYGGYPFHDLCHKFLLADQSFSQPLTEDRLPEGMKAISLPGHFFSMVGYKTDEDIVFLADCLSSKKTLDKYAIGFIYDVKSYLETLENIKKMDARIFIPSHAEPTQNIIPLANYNIQKVNEISEKILSICSFPITFENILQKIFESYSLTMTYEQYVLVGSTVRSYLSYLKNMGDLDAYFEKNLLLWIKK